MVIISNFIVNESWYSWQTSHIDSPWNRGWGELGNGLIWCGKNVKFDRVCRIILHWSGRWFLRRSSHMPNQMHILWYVINLPICTSDNLLCYEEEKMAAKDLVECKLCKRWTKHCSIQCKLAICNFCCEPELDENVDGWIDGKQVGCCFACYRKLSWKQSYTSLIASDEGREKLEDEAAEVHSEKERKSFSLIAKLNYGAKMWYRTQAFLFLPTWIKTWPDTQCVSRQCRSKVDLDSIRFDTWAERRLNRA